MKVKMKQALSGSDKSYDIGETVEFDDAQGFRLCEAGIAEAVDQKEYAGLMTRANAERAVLTKRDATEALRAKYADLKKAQDEAKEKADAVNADLKAAEKDLKDAEAVLAKKPDETAPAA